MSPALPREERDAIRARVDRATEGPWGHRAHAHGLPSDGPTHVCVFDPEDVLVAELDYSSWGERDAEFIAHARTDVPALLDALDAAEAEVAALRGRIEALHRPDDHGPGRCDMAECFTSCVECGDDWPCATIRALAADEGERTGR